MTKELPIYFIVSLGFPEEVPQKLLQELSSFPKELVSVEKVKGKYRWRYDAICNGDMPFYTFVEEELSRLLKHKEAIQGLECKKWIYFHYCHSPATPLPTFEILNPTLLSLAEMGFNFSVDAYELLEEGNGTIV